MFLKKIFFGSCFSRSHRVFVASRHFYHVTKVSRSHVIMNSFTTFTREINMRCAFCVTVLSCLHICSLNIESTSSLTFLAVFRCRAHARVKLGGPILKTLGVQRKERRLALLICGMNEG